MTRFRREWADTYLTRYVRQRWEREIRDAGKTYNLALTQKGKPPTLVTFAKMAEVPTNHWFGGDISGVYSAIGEKCPEPIDPARHYPLDRVDFGTAVFTILGGTRHTPQPIANYSSPEYQQHIQQRDRLDALNRLANMSLRYIQLEDALARLPDIRDIGASDFAALAPVLDPDMGKAWQIFEAAIRQAKTAPHAH